MVYHEFIVPKPANWMQLAMYEKIKYYGEHMNIHYAKYVDKIQAKQIIKEICGDEIKTAPIIKILKHPTDITTQDLKVHTIVKAAHGSGWNIPILNINENTLATVHDKLKRWNQKYSLTEKQYTFLKPQFFIEEIIDDKYYGKNRNAVTYLVRCINGKAITISPYLKDTTEISNYDINWNVYYKNDIPHIDKPVHLEKMIKYAELLSAPFEFVRVDFYVDKNDDIYFSEFTFTPRAGIIGYSYEIEKKQGDLWT